jgi:hypothetical protein
MKILKKIFKVLFWVLVVFLLAILFFYFKFSPTKNPKWGINFSANQARYLGLNPKDVYSEMLTDLKPKKLRLVTYWEDIEKEKGSYQFQDIDLMLFQAEKAGAKVTLVVGHKQPRWPECHHPDWYNALSEAQKREALLNFVKASVMHFKNFSIIERWQVENEPFFNFGPDCRVLTLKELKEEVNLVKSLDNRPILITDSGEKGDWFSAGSVADVFGTTMYRTVFHSRFNRYITYPLPPAWYKVRSGMLLAFTSVKQVIGAELQAEPWFEGNFHDTSIDKQLEIMSLEKFSGNITYAKNTGLSEHYLWGVEWWYYMKQNGYPEFWEKIKVLIYNN